ncbi:MAG: LysM peptidoglycan-binding domain-containing protein [Acidimicrobiales bacterium]
MIRRPTHARNRRLAPGSVAAITALALVVPAGLAACGGASGPLDALPSESSVEVTDYVTLPPPTTTIPPTTTLPPEPGSVLTSEATYVIVEGDYPFVVANRFGVDFKEFVALNGWEIVDGQVPDWPAPGTTIRIPAGATVPGGPSVLVPVPTTTTTVPPGVPTVPASEPAAETTTTVDDGIGCGVYTVAEGDYKLLVADKLDTTVDELDAANADTDGYGAFYVGLKINVPC